MCISEYPPKVTFNAPVGLVQDLFKVPIEPQHIQDDDIILSQVRVYTEAAGTNTEL